MRSTDRPLLLKISGRLQIAYYFNPQRQLDELGARAKDNENMTERSAVKARRELFRSPAAST